MLQSWLKEICSKPIKAACVCALYIWMSVSSCLMKVSYEGEQTPLTLLLLLSSLPYICLLIVKHLNYLLLRLDLWCLFNFSTAIRRELKGRDHRSWDPDVSREDPGDEILRGEVPGLCPEVVGPEDRAHPDRTAHDLESLPEGEWALNIICGRHEKSPYEESPKLENRA